jgi:hypothetical protein
MTENKFRSTKIYGKLNIVDSTDGSILADGNFNRDLTIQNNLILGNETYDASGNVLLTKGNIKFTLNKIVYTIPLITLSYLNNLTSNIQTQLNNIFTQNNTFSGTTTFNNLVAQNIGSFNTAFGTNALIQSTGERNTAFGNNTLKLNTTGYCNTALGNNCATSNTTGYHNLTAGYDSMKLNTIGTFNVALGTTTLSSNVNGSYNTCVGFGAGNSITSNSNTCIGYSSNVLNNASNSTAIGYGAICTTSNQIMIGTSTQTVDVPGNIFLSNVTFFGTINGISNTLFNYLTNVSSDLQTQLDTITTNISNLVLPISPILNNANVFTAINKFVNYVEIGTGVNDALLVRGSETVTGPFYANSDCVIGASTTNELTVNSMTTFLNTVTLNSTITFIQSINNISATTFNYLNGVTSNIQAQINSINTNAVNLYNQIQSLNSSIQALNSYFQAGTIITSVAMSTNIPGYLYCDGSEFLKTSYPNLYAAIGTQYGTPIDSLKFSIPNFQAEFLRGYVPQTFNNRNFIGNNVGLINSDELRFQNPFDTTNNITTTTINTSGGTNAVIKSINFSTISINIGSSTETCPINSSVKYFIKY